MSFADRSDFVLFPNPLQSKMLALEAGRPKQYFQPMMDPNMEMLQYSMDMQQYAQNIDYSRIPQSYFDTPALYSEAELHKHSNFSSMPATPPSVTTSYATEPQIPTGSAASGPSIASAPSSAIGSPYSGPTHVFQENWLNTNHGLGLPAAVMPEYFPNDYMGNAGDMDGLYREKIPDPFVGQFRNHTQIQDWY